MARNWDDVRRNAGAEVGTLDSSQASTTSAKVPGQPKSNGIDTSNELAGYGRLRGALMDSPYVHVICNNKKKYLCDVNFRAAVANLATTQYQ